MLQIDEEVEDVRRIEGIFSSSSTFSSSSSSPQMLIQIAEEFVDSTLLASCQNAKHRKSNTVEAKDVQLYLGQRRQNLLFTNRFAVVSERTYSMWIPGFGTEDPKAYKKFLSNDALKAVRGKRVVFLSFSTECFCCLGIENAVHIVNGHNKRIHWQTGASTIELMPLLFFRLFIVSMLMRMKIKYLFV